MEGSNSRIYGSSGGLFEGGGLLTICSSRVGAYSRGGGAFSRIYGTLSVLYIPVFTRLVFFIFFRFPSVFNWLT